MEEPKSRFLANFERRIRDGGRCSPDCGPLELPGGPETYLRILQGMKDDPRAMPALRSLLSRFRDGVWRFDDHEVVRQVSELLGARRLHICAGQERGLPMGTLEAEVEAPEQAPPPSESASTSAPPPEPPTFGADHDAGGQAGALRNAAALGIPFCEVCERARRQQQ